MYGVGFIRNCFDDDGIMLDLFGCEVGLFCVIGVIYVVVKCLIEKFGGVLLCF